MDAIKVLRDEKPDSKALISFESLLESMYKKQIVELSAIRSEVDHKKLEKEMKETLSAMGTTLDNLNK